VKLFAYQDHQRKALGVEKGGIVVDLTDAHALYVLENGGSLFPSDEITKDMLALIRYGEAAWLGLEKLLDWLAVQKNPIPGNIGIKLENVKLAAPIENPSKIICVGLNYRDHCEETGTPIPEKPIFFCKFPSSIIGPDDPVSWPPGSSSQVDYEAELAVVIKKPCKGISPGEAWDYIAGYTMLNDISARDAQFADGQWIRGKSFDSFCPVGPYIVTPDEVGNPDSLIIRCRLNGELMQDSNTGKMIFKIPELLSYLSETITLEPGDILSTGTPHGVGFSRTPPVYLKPGDQLEIEIENLGVLKNFVA
jgi:2-keto-4-pentenoate hydratase/2-oxohepta-3-ene-1,7-dioic acid hydratase in catechol pathway